MRFTNSQAHNHCLFVVLGWKFPDFHMATFVTYVVLAGISICDPAKVTVPTLLGAQNT